MDVECWGECKQEKGSLTSCWKHLKMRWHGPNSVIPKKKPVANWLLPCK